jgi:aspartyl-tRNA(Asn)/glutamyl-tRNA(Gln) amidotransferase subunit B
MEEGSLRCDVNVSIRPRGETAMGTKTEIKNLNSFKAVELGIRFEIERQEGILGKGGAITQVTNLWDAAGKRLVTMRSKEYAHDYRYFPEPDLMPLEIDADWTDELWATIPELALERERRFRTEYGLSAYDAAVLCAERGVADYYEEVVAGTGDPKTSSNWVMREVLEGLKSSDGGIEDYPVRPGHLAGLIGLVKDGTISQSAGRDVFMEMLETGEEPAAAVRRLGLRQISGEDELESMIDRILAEHPEEIERYKAGKSQLLKFFVGEVMKESRGKANPKLTGILIRKKLES